MATTVSHSSSLIGDSSSTSTTSDDSSLYPIAVLIDELRNDDVQVINNSLIDT